MIHRLTLPAIIRLDFEQRKVFTRYHGAQHIMMSDTSIKCGTEDLEALVEHCERYGHVSTTPNPKLVIAYVRFAEKIRGLLRADAGNESTGRDGKSAAAGEKDE